MNKFDSIFLSIKRRIVNESLDVNHDIEYHIDLNLNLINEKYCKDGVDISFIEKNNNFFKIEILQLPDNQDSIRLISNSRQKIEGLLGTFIDSDKYDEVCSWIILNDKGY